jgi:hypothetical protein
MSQIKVVDNLKFFCSSEGQTKEKEKRKNG